MNLLKKLLLCFKRKKNTNDVCVGYEYEDHHSHRRRSRRDRRRFIRRACDRPERDRQKRWPRKPTPYPEELLITSQWRRKLATLPEE